MNSVSQYHKKIHEIYFQGFLLCFQVMRLSLNMPLPLRYNDSPLSQLVRSIAST